MSSYVGEVGMGITFFRMKLRICRISADRVEQHFCHLTKEIEYHLFIHLSTLSPTTMLISMTDLAMTLVDCGQVQHSREVPPQLIPNVLSRPVGGGG